MTSSRTGSSLRRSMLSALGAGRRMRVSAGVASACLIFALSLLVRTLHATDLAAVMYTVDQPFGGLTQIYDQRATSITRGEGLLGPYELKPDETIWLTQAPGYSIFLSSVYSLSSRDFFKVQLAQDLINSLTPVVIFLIGGLLLSWRVGQVAGVLSAVSHHLAHISNFILPDSLCALPISAAVLCLVLARRGRWRRWPLLLASGVLIGIASWLRPQTLALGPFVAILLVVMFRRQARAIVGAVLMAIASLLVIVPITARNYSVYHAFVPITVGLGLNLWEGIADASGDRFGAVATDDGVAAQEAILYGRPEYGGSPNTPDVIARDRDRTEKSLAIIKSHPFWYAGVMLGRMRDMLKYSAGAPLVLSSEKAGNVERAAPVRKGWGDLAEASTLPQAGSYLWWSRAGVRALQRVSKEAMLGCVLIGLLVVGIAAPRRAALLFVVPGYYLLFQSLMHTEFRYTLPAQYFLFLFAGATWVLFLTLIWRAIKRLFVSSRASSSVSAI